MHEEEVDIEDESSSLRRSYEEQQVRNGTHIHPPPCGCVALHNSVDTSLPMRCKLRDFPQRLMTESDKRLDELHDSVVRLGHVSSSITDELHVHNELIDDIEAGVDTAQGTVESVTKRTKDIVEYAGALVCVNLYADASIVLAPSSTGLGDGTRDCAFGPSSVFSHSFWFIAYQPQVVRLTHVQSARYSEHSCF